MSTGYICEQCDRRVVLVNSGGVWRDIICRQCGDEMEYDEDVQTEYVGHEDPDNDYAIADE